MQRIATRAITPVLAGLLLVAGCSKQRGTGSGDGSRPRAGSGSPAPTLDAVSAGTMETGEYTMTADDTSCRLSVTRTDTAELTFDLECSTEAAHTGEIEGGVARRADARGPFVFEVVEDGGDERCRIEISARDAGVLELQQRGATACDFGAGVDASGRYVADP